MTPDCYDVILEYFQTTSDSPAEQEIWKNRAYTTLITLWKENKISTQNARNALILLLNLFEDIPPDIFNSRGRDVKENKNYPHKKQVKAILKQELTTSE